MFETIDIIEAFNEYLETLNEYLEIFNEYLTFKYL